MQIRILVLFNFAVRSSHENLGKKKNKNSYQWNLDITKNEPMPEE